jgi:hypothetical protein
VTRRNLAATRERPRPASADQRLRELGSLVYGVASLLLGTPVELEGIFEVSD